MDQFDVLYERMGTGSIRWDRAKAKFGTDKELLPHQPVPQPAEESAPQESGEAKEEKR